MVFPLCVWHSDLYIADKHMILTPNVRTFCRLLEREIPSHKIIYTNQRQHHLKTNENQLQHRWQEQKRERRWRQREKMSGNWTRVTRVHRMEMQDTRNGFVFVLCVCFFFVYCGYFHRYRCKLTCSCELQVVVDLYFSPRLCRCANRKRNTEIKTHTHIPFHSNKQTTESIVLTAIRRLLLLLRSRQMSINHGRICACAQLLLYASSIYLLLSYFMLRFVRWLCGLGQRDKHWKKKDVDRKWHYAAV